MDLLDVYRGRMSWRRLRVLIQHLPPESATMTAMRAGLSEEELARQAEQGEPEGGRWSQAEQLLALIGDRLARVEYVLRLAHHGKGRRPDPPEPIRRPGVTSQRRRKVALSDSGAETLFRLINGGA